MKRDVRIRGETIRLGQLLKLAGVIDSGAEVKAFLSTVPVWVNGEREARRGRKLHADDIVQIDELELRLTSEDLEIRRPDLRGVRRLGVVRWYKDDKGYGRITAEDGEERSAGATMGAGETSCGPGASMRACSGWVMTRTVTGPL